MKLEKNSYKKKLCKKNNSNVPEKTQKSLVEKVGGLDNLFNILDSDNDGKISDDEISTFANIDSVEFSDKKSSLSLRDFKKFYENAVDAKGAKHTIDGNVENFSFRDGSSVKIYKDDDGNVVSKVSEDYYANNDKLTTTNDYKTRTTSYRITDSQNQVYFDSVDAPGIINDKVTKVTFNSDNSKVVTTNTVARTTIETIDSAGKTISKTEELKYNSDGVIGDTKQHNVGNCWLLAGINALKNNEQCAAFIKDAIQHNSYNTITVKLKGVNKEYTYSPEQIALHSYTIPTKYFSSGGIDMNLLEMAITDYRKEVLSANPDKKPINMSIASVEDPANGGYLNEAIHYITGKTADVETDKSKFKNLLKKKQKEADKYVLTLQFLKEDKSISDTAVIPKHAYSVSRVTEDTVYIINPADSSKEIAYPKKKFMENCMGMASFKFE